MKWYDRVDWRWVWGTLLVVVIVWVGISSTYEWNRATDEQRAEMQDAQCIQLPC